MSSFARWVVLANGSAVSASLFTWQDANALAKRLLSQGYDDVVIMLA